MGAGMDFVDDPQAWVEQVRPTLPTHVNIEALTATSAYMALPLAVVVLWTDRPYGECPRCRQPVARTGPCPLYLDGGNPNNPLKSVDLAHRCGAWLDTPEEAIDAEDLTPARVRRAAQGLAHIWQEQVQERRQRRRARLRTEIAELATTHPRWDDESVQDYRERLAGPGCTEPGPYWDREQHRWAAWDYDPADDTEVLVEYQEPETG
ncbi:hypothetical protein NE857_34050 (plasmid) [Nocardiopsis exhalans]|uniref:Uncharacterized protein n=1 Tax=Nocardiopsis exhalans TaxID=163604 RepID=A0ABY5DHN9_9ACTN|nr:hypothetical protein [Nocardiopsis exhalans]USY23557.1 hypothetical protein NE857_34050 [Nocardiopsis exhalans]